MAYDRQYPVGMALGHAQQLGDLGYRHLVFQNGVEHGESGLFFLVQRYVLHDEDCDDGSRPSRPGSDP